jgi:hypothetical protein
VPACLNAPYMLGHVSACLLERTSLGHVSACLLECTSLGHVSACLLECTSSSPNRTNLHLAGGGEEDLVVYSYIGHYILVIIYWSLYIGHYILVIIYWSSYIGHYISLVIMYNRHSQQISAPPSCRHLSRRRRRPGPFTLISPAAERRKFSGFTSRWTTGGAWLCRYSTPHAHPCPARAPLVSWLHPRPHRGGQGCMPAC